MAVKKPPVGAHYGLRDWVIQRATAALMILAFGILGAALIVCRPSGYDEWREFMGAGWIRLLVFFTVAAISWHGLIGARDIVMDYLKNDMLRLAKHVGIAAYFIVCTAWAAMILLAPAGGA